MIIQIKRYGICIFITEKKGQQTRKDKNERLVFLVCEGR